MKELRPKGPSMVANYEQHVAKSYDVLGAEGLDARKWGTAIKQNGERFNAYTDRGYIDKVFGVPLREQIEGLGDEGGQFVIADFGGDDGFLLHQVMEDVEQVDTQKEIAGLVVDFDSTGKAKEKFLDRKAAGERKDMEYVVADITRLPFADASIDAIISRMSIQYLDAEQQVVFWEEVSRVLKENGLGIILSLTGFYDHKQFNSMVQSVVSIISGSQDWQRRMPAFNDFSNRARFEERYSLAPGFASRVLEFPMSVAAWADRFELSEKQLASLIELYQTKKKEFPDLFEIWDGELCLQSRLLEIRLRKKSNDKS